MQNVNIINDKSLKNYFGNDEIGNEMYECIQSIPIRFRQDALDIFCDRFDRNMWNFKSINKAWDYFLMEIIPEMNQKEKEKYGF